MEEYDDILQQPTRLGYRTNEEIRQQQTMTTSSSPMISSHGTGSSHLASGYGQGSLSSPLDGPMDGGNNGPVLGLEEYGANGGTSNSAPVTSLLASLPAHSQQQLEEERLRKDILRYLVNSSNGTYHYSADLRAIAYDVVGVPRHSTPPGELQQTLQSLLNVLHADPQKRFLISGDGDNIIVKRCFVRGDEEEIADLVEEWRLEIAHFLLDCKRSVGLSDIGSSVPRPARIPSSVKLIFIMKTDPMNRFLIKGEGNAAKARYNMQTDPDQEGMWLNKWRDDIASFLTKQQWACPTVGLHEIGAHVERPFFLPGRVKLLETLQLDPLQRFIVTGVGNDTRIMIRTFRGDEPEIGEYVEHWRLIILQYMLSKCAALGVSQPLLGLSEIGANVPRPHTVPTSVKLIDVMRGDPMVRFLVKGEGNALRARINPNCRHLLPSMLAGLPPLPVPMQSHGAYTAEGEYIPGSANTSGHYGPPMMYGGGGGMGGGHRPPMMMQHQQPYHHHSSHSYDNHSEDGTYGQYGYDGQQQQHRPSPSSYRPTVPMPPPNVRSVGYGNNANDYDDNDYFDNSNASTAGYPPRNSNSGGSTAQQSALRQLHQLHQQSTRGPSPNVLSGPYSGHGQMYNPAGQSMDHYNSRSNGNNNNYRLPPGAASNAGSSGYRMGGPGMNSSTHSMSSSSNNTSAMTSAHGGAGNMMGGYALALGGSGGMGSNHNNYGQRPPPMHVGSTLDYRSTNGGSMHSNSSSSSGETGLTALGGGIFGSGGMTTTSPSTHSSSNHHDPSSSSSSGSMGLANIGSLFSGLGGSGNSGSMASGDDQEWQRALGLTGGGVGGNDGPTNINNSSSLNSPSMNQLTSFSGTSKSTATTMESLDNNSNRGHLLLEQRASTAAAAVSQHQLSSFSSNLHGLTDGSTSGNEHLAVGSKASPSSMHQQGGFPLLHSGFMSPFDDPSLPDNYHSSSHNHDSSSLHSKSSSSNPVVGSNLHNTSARSTSGATPTQPKDPGLRGAGSFGALGSHAADEFDNDDDGTIAHPPLDKWMIKVWLPLVFEGFEYDLIDSFVNRLRDDGGFVTVQDLLDAQSRGELTRQSLADMAGFKVGHCNRLDRALATYTNKPSPPTEPTPPVAVASARKESEATTTTMVVEHSSANTATAGEGEEGNDIDAVGIAKDMDSPRTAAAQAQDTSLASADNRRSSIRALVVEKPLL